MSSNERKSADAKKTGEPGKFDRFNLAKRPVRPPGRNAYFDDIKSQLALQQQDGVAAGQQAVQPSDEEEIVAGGVDPLVDVKLSDGVTDGASADAELAELSSTEMPGAVAAPTNQNSKKGPHRLSIASQVPAPAVEGRKGTSSNASPPQTATAEGFAEFKKEWDLLLKGNLMKICEILYKHTFGVDLTEYSTTTEDLCKEVGVSSRHLLHLLAHLEKLGFVTRRDAKIGNNRTVGKIITFYPRRLR